MASYQYDLVVVGSGPAGQKAAICAAKLRKQVAVTDRRHMLGGASLHTGTSQVGGTGRADAASGGASSAGTQTANQHSDGHSSAGSGNSGR